MPDAPSTRETAEPITATIADHVRKLRVSAGMSQDDLAKAMSALGVPWKRATVVNLEKRGPSSRGDAATGRDALTVGELLALALVLGVPPALLLADPRTGRSVVAVRGVSMSADVALSWITGAAPVDASGADDDAPKIAQTQPGVAEFMIRWHHAKQAQQRLFELRRVRHRLVVDAGGIGQRSEVVDRDGLDETADQLGRQLADAYRQALADLAEYLPGQAG